MNNRGIPAHVAVEQVLGDTHGLPLFLAGSSVAALLAGKDHAYSDVDLFAPNEGMYFVAVQHLLNNGYEITDDKFVKMWRRHQEFGFKGWHTNSMHLVHQAFGFDVNVIYKRVDNHNTTRLSQVLESFDFGLLAVGYEAKSGSLHDMRPYFFGPDVDRPLPMLPYRAEAISQGLMSQHIMLRMPGRYARYAYTYGYDLSLVKPTLVSGYQEYAAYKLDRSKDEDITLGQIAQAIGTHIELDEYEELLQFEKDLPVADGLDQIMASLE